MNCLRMTQRGRTVGRLVGIVLVILPLQHIFGQSITEIDWQTVGQNPTSMGVAIGAGHSGFPLILTVKISRAPTLRKIYLGCTYRAGGREVNLPPQAVRSYSSMKKFEIPPTATSVVFALWRGERDGQMYGRIQSTGWLQMPVPHLSQNLSSAFGGVLWH